MSADRTRDRDTARARSRGRPERGAGALLVVAAALLACGGGPPSKVTGAPRVPPDESYQVGGIGHYEGFIWNCTGGERVHVSRTCGEFLGCNSWTLERGPCGRPLPGEPLAKTREPMTFARWE